MPARGAIGARAAIAAGLAETSVVDAGLVWSEAITGVVAAARAALGAGAAGSVIGGAVLRGGRLQAASESCCKCGPTSAACDEPLENLAS